MQAVDCFRFTGPVDPCTSTGGIIASNVLPATVIPLALFIAGAHLLPMISTGILFYFTPSLLFLCGVFALGETLNPDNLIGFTGIWLGLVLFTYSLIKD